MKNRIILLLCLVILGITYLESLEMGKIVMPDQLKAGDDTLDLSGSGWRKKLIVKVYACGLYLPQSSEDALSILESDEPMAIRMHFVYSSVSEDKLIGAWNEGFANAATPDSLQPKVAEFNSFFSKPAVADDIYEIVYLPETGTSLLINNELIGTIEGVDFKKAVFSIWLGENTALSKLRADLLNL